ncbi:MAG: glycosyltransferase family 39 protein [Verrucomicrobia bacterium]|nr:glycosyltransferase family 39 protein [Verrucomicrobiota bacterium]
MLRLLHLSAEQLWLDEADTIRIASMPIPSLLNQMTVGNKPPLYFLLMQQWIHVWGRNPWAVRLFSALFGIATVPLLYLLGRSWCSRRSGLLAAFIWSIAQISVYYGREGRNYTLVAFLLCSGVYALDRAVRKPDRVYSWVGYGVCLIMSIYTSYPGFILLPINGIQVLLARRGSIRICKIRGLRPWLLSVGAVSFLYLPWLTVLLRQLSNMSGSIRWLIPYWEAYPPILAIPKSFLGFMPGGALSPFVAMYWNASLQTFAILALLGFLALAFWPAETGLLRDYSRTSRTLLASLCILPLLGIWGVSFITPIYIMGRVDFIAFPGFCLVLGMAIDRPKGHFTRIALLLLIVLGAFTSLSKYYRHPIRIHEEQPLRTLAQNLDAHDLVIFTDLSRPTGEYYLRHHALERDTVFLSYPADMENHHADIDRRSFEQTPEVLANDADNIVAQADTTLARGGKVFVLFIAEDMNRFLLDTLSRTFRIESAYGIEPYILNQVGDTEKPVHILKLSPDG